MNLKMEKLWKYDAKKTYLNTKKTNRTLQPYMV